MKIFKKTLAMLLSIIMVFGIVPASVFMASAEEASTCPIEGATGTGTEADPIIVDTFEELKAALTYSPELYVQVDTDIECTESIMVKGSKTLTVNGKLYSDTTVLFGPGSSNVLTIQGTGSIVSKDICVNALGRVTLKGDVTYESTGESTVFSNTSNLRIEGGTFKNDGKYCYGLYLNNDKAVFAGGSFPGGIGGFSDGTYELENGYMFSYEDGSVSGVLQPDVPVDVVFVSNYDIGFATQTPAMPEGETVTHLGDFTVGASEAAVSFGFTSNPLPDEMIQKGFSITEELLVYSYNNGLLAEQTSGVTYTIDNTVADTYTVYEKIVLKDDKGVVCDTLQYIFTLSIHPVGYTEDTACPIEGATGSGKESNPVVVDTYAELKAALEYTNKLYIKVDGYIECLETIEVKGNESVLFVNGTLHCENTVLSMSIDNDLTLQGNGKILSDSGACLLLSRSNNIAINGNITFETNGINAIEAPDTTVGGGTLTIGGGTFKSNDINGRSVYVNTTLRLDIVLSGGSFPNGIGGRGVDCELASKCYYKYEDTVDSSFRANTPFYVIDATNAFGFETQTPVMPEGKTEFFLGNYTVGTQEARITFGFSAKPLPDEFKESGYSITEKMTVISAKNGIVKTQNSGEAYTIDNTVADSFTVYQTITVLDADGDVSEKITNTFTVSVQPVGYTPDPDCPIEGATGSGTKADPVIVDTYAELKAALKHSENLYIQANGYIEFLETIKPETGKTLTLNGTLHGEGFIFEVWCDRFVLLGNGKITSEQANCLLNFGADTIIAGNFEIHSGGVGYDTISASEGKLTLSGVTVTNSRYRSLAIDNEATVVLKSGKFPNGISGNATLSSESLYQYEAGTLSNTLQQNVPVNVFGLKFATQTPAMPGDQTTTDFDEYFEHGIDSDFTFSFASKPLPQDLIEGGYSVTEEMTVYSEKQGKVIHTQSNGNAYTIAKSGLDTYTVTETIELVKDGEVIATLTHTFTNVAVKQSDLFGFESHSPAVSEEESQNGSKDLGTFIPYLFDGKFSFTPYISEALVNKGYHILTTTLLRKNGTQVYFNSGDTKDDVSSYITGYGDYQFMQKINLYDSENNFIDSVYFSYYFTVEDLRNTFGFTSHSPELSAEDAFDGRTDLGVIFEAPSFSYTARDISDEMKAAGYNLVFKTTVYHTDTAVQESDDPYSWTCGVYDYGTKTVRQSLMLYAPNGTLVSAWHHTYTFTYLPLKFDTRIPSVSDDDLAAGFTDLGTLTTAPKFSFSAVPLDFTLKEEGYSIALKTEAYQGDTLVYSADNGDVYTHIYPGEGTVFQTIYMLDGDGEVLGSVSHAYTFTVEFPEGTIALDADFLTLAENSTHQLSATFAPESLAETLVWTSSNSAVATIDSNGNITAVRAGSVLITATLGNGATAYCTVLVTAEDVKAYVGGIGLAEGEYLAQGSSIPTTVKPADNYAYLATVNGKLTLTLHNYSYSGMGTFTSKNVAYGIYSTQELKVIAEGTNKIGAMSAPVERYTSYGIGKGDTVSISSDANGVLNITGVSTGISSSRYVFVSGNLNITDVTSGISATHAQAMGGINFQSGNVNINCTGTAISVTGNYVTFTGADVTINCKAGINLVRQGEITIDDGSLKMYASASGINVKSGLAMTVNGGTAYIEAVNNAVALEGALNINGGSIVLISTDTASDDSYSAISGAGTLTLASGISSVASTSSNYSTSSLYADSRRSTLDYVSFRGGSNYAFVKQPVGGDAKASGTMTITWETGFKPTKLELITFDGTSSTVTTLNSYLNYADFDVLPEGGYYQLRAYYATNYSITSDKFYVYSTAHTVTFCLGDSPVVTQDVADGECAHPIAEPGMDHKFFYGWLTEDGKVFDFSTPITEDITLTAGWADIKVNGVAMPDGTYLGLYSGAVTTGRPSDHWAYYKDGILTLYNFDSPYGAGIEFGEIDLTIVSSGNGNTVSCIVSYYDYANLTIDGTATLNVGHSQWLDYAILVYNTITFKCDTIVECLDYTAIGDAEEIIVDGADVKVYAYCDMYFSNTIYGCEAPITVLSGSLYLYCEGDGTNTDSYVTNPDKVLVYASDSVDGDLTDDHIIKTGGEAYDLELYRQIKITSYNTVKFHVDGYAVLMQKVPTGMCIEKPLDSDYGNRVFLGWCTEDGSLYDFNTPVTEDLSLYAKFAVVEPVHGDFDFENNIISGILPGTTSLDYYGTFTNPDYAWSYQTENGYLGTGTGANVVNGDEIIESYSILLYGDVNGDGWCDGMDAVLVSCIVNGMLSESDISELAYRAADCNHDGVIDEADVDLLNQAGTLLAEVDQTKSAEVLLETSSAYVEYIELIDQTPEIDVEDETDAPEADVEPEDTTPEQNAKIDIFEMIISFIKSIFEMLLAFIPVPIK